MKPAAINFQLENARACAAASLMAYTHAPNVFAADTDTQVLVLEEADHIIIAFRGTSNIRDWITDAQFMRTVLSDHPDVGRVEVHSGFLRAFESVIVPLTTYLRQLVVGERKVFVTGHSLGGALAILCAFELKKQSFNVQQVYTFGQPRVGNGAFKKLYEAPLGNQTFRVVYQEDIVARVPHFPCWQDPYRHVGREIFLSAFRELVVAPSLWHLLASDAWGIYRAFIISKFTGALDPLNDHRVLNYTQTLEEIKSC